MLVFRSHRLLWFLAASCMLFAPAVSSAGASKSAPKAAPEVAAQRLVVAEGALLPIYVSRDWSRPLPDIERVVILLHGHARNAGGYFRTGLSAQTAAGDVGRHALVVAPQFIDSLDAATFHVPAEVLRFTPEGWEGGEPALAPRPISSFEALDAVLRKLRDQTVFPNLKDVVLAGHSGGAQVVQRYAILGKEASALTRVGISVRYVVANPSSYAYFSSDRPVPEIARTCPRVDDWKYGMRHLPAYAGSASAADLEKTYVDARVFYLLGSRDTDPNHPVLDKSCMGEAQGSNRWERGHAYFAAMKDHRNGGIPRHELHAVADVGHDGDRMFTSTCGLAALFDVPGCR